MRTRRGNPGRPVQAATRNLRTRKISGDDLLIWGGVSIGGLFTVVLAILVWYL
jgi:hypothetical protein